MKLIRRWIVVCTLLLVLANACNDEEPAINNSYINNWIFDNMSFWYYWADELPQNPNKKTEPESFFNSLLSDEDRFSWIQDDYEELLNSLQGINKEAGYEFRLYRESQSNENVIAQIMYVKADSPAETTGLLRGDLINEINGQQITLSNYESLINQLTENHTIRYDRYNFSTEQFEDKGTLSLNTIEYSENPNYYSTVYELSGRKIGYYMYNFFANGPSENSTTFNDEMDNIFSGFQASGITDLIVDLRFNSGGSETATINLASLIGNGINVTNIFAKREYNPVVEQAIINEPDLGEDFLTSEFVSKSQNVGSLLSGNRVYVLTSSRSASASELLINGLKPYMEVRIIGDTTYGKNYGSITLTDDQNSANKWGMQPIVVKSYNSLDQSEYGNGFFPDIVDLDNDLVLYPLGDINERLLNIALEDITGTSVGGRKSAIEEMRLSNPILHSIDKNRRGIQPLFDYKHLLQNLNMIK